MPTSKPMPRETEATRPFWQALREQRVVIQRCADCDQWIFYPRHHCSHCPSTRLAWHEVPGTGTLYTYTVARIPTLPDFVDEAPQKLAVVALDEGPHLNTTLIGLAESGIRIGMRVRPVFDVVDETGATLLRYTGIDTVLAGKPAAGVAAAPGPAPAVARRQIRSDDLEAMKSLVSADFSPWSNEIVVDQDMINRFAELSGDDYWLHTDPERARKEGPFGGTIAHGSLIQVLSSRLTIPLDYEVVGFTNMVNYGSDRLRFPSPVRAGSRIHGRMRVKAVEKVKSGTQMTLELNIHVVGSERPAAINDLVVLYM
ncbi:MAG: MaoC/PaaZ C-terminal domain-containing protein [Steroidobacteraceae bacterium]